MINFNITEFFIVAGSIHGIIFTFILLIRSKKIFINQNLALSFFIIIFSTVVLNGWYYGSGYYLLKPSFLFLPIYFTLGLGSTFYIYISLLLQKDYVFDRKQLLHLGPAFLQFCFHFYLFLKPVNERIIIFKNEYMAIFLPIEEILGMCFLGIYFYISYRIVKKYKQSIESNYTDIRKNMLKWINHFILAVFVLLASWLIFSLIDLFVYDYKQSFSFYYPAYIFIVIIIHWIIYRGFFNPLIIKPDVIENPVSASYSLPEKEIQLNLRKLNETMEKHKLYLKPKLSLQELADEIDINSKYLSQLINKELNKTFHDFVNNYRIEYAKKELLSINNTHITILAISEICGFNSKSTFNEVFKKFTDQTPTQFIKSNS